ncbi:putative leucine-rich repeat domain superfamily [Helianthus annuus]|uniref:Leucine-rich repeat domain superfamily n=1 Tax=Helianthus annuus TaxID=4232 RepID=A0A251UB45_HELAN|nr:putative leucine-rich repeat domain superfamily [Helianthus annuus]KAJ0731704.1 hypothetical protein HanOQP8_Chr07g0254981 [Helianthus annuus]
MFRDQLMGALEGECLDRFCLHFRLQSLVLITTWIDDVICCHVRELDLEVPDLDMPASFFTCGTLSKLRLQLIRFVMDEEQVSWHRDLVVNFPSLSFFDTFAHQIVAANVIRIIQGSPSLKSVKLSGCCFGGKLITFEWTCSPEGSDYSVERRTLKPEEGVSNVQEGIFEASLVCRIVSYFCLL